jgi:AraC-like DNA-binding protein
MRRAAAMTQQARFMTSQVRPSRAGAGVASVAASYPKAFLDFAVSRGASREELARRSGITESDLVSPDERIELGRYLALIQAGAELTREPALAVHFGRDVRAETISIVALISLASETVGAAFVQMARYARLVLDASLPVPPGELVYENGEPWIVSTDPAYALYPHLWEILMAQMMSGFRRMFPEMPPGILIHCPHPPPSYRGEVESVMGAQVVFDAGRFAVRVPQAVLDIRLPAFNRYAFSLLSERAEALLKALEAEGTMRADVERRLMATLHTGGSSAEALSRTLNVSQKTLYRRLKAEGVTFEQVLDDLRRRLAISFLTDGKVSVTEAAYLVGFSDPSAFARAFKRWTGMSPGRFPGSPARSAIQD